MKSYARELVAFLRSAWLRRLSRRKDDVVRGAAGCNDSHTVTGLESTALCDLGSCERRIQES